MLTIAVDAMGGDHAPKSEVEGAVKAARALGVRVILVGRQDVLRRELQEYDDHRGLPMEIVHASEQVTMEDSAARAVRSKRDSSMRVASRLVRDGIAQGFVSAGNTGAVMATAKMVQGVVPGVDRPALAGIFPTLVGKPVVVIDVGANVDCSPRMLAQFAVMGEIYSRVVLHRERPRVGLLSIGEEEHKGNEITRGATPLLKSLPIEFHRQRGRARYLHRQVGRDRLRRLHRQRRPEGQRRAGGHGEADAAGIAARPPSPGKIGYVLARAAFSDFKKRVDYSEYGGAPLLGVRGVCIICHGRSNANAIKNAIRVAAEFSGGNVNQRIEEELRQWAAEHVAF